MTLKNISNGIAYVTAIVGNTIRFASSITIDRRDRPRAEDRILVSFVFFLSSLRPMAIPNIVENSAKAFIVAPTTSPLRARIARRATADVVIPDAKPKNSRERTIGTPVKSNFR